ncbi:MAG: shikimate kinase [Cyanobacteria bacterium P01_D01_bin.128]
MIDSLKGTNLYLIGMMGAGKTSVGKRLSKQLNYRFFDTEALIEQATGESIAQIFATEGENAFRQLETDVLAQLAPYTRLVVATGGGIVLKPENWGYLQHGIVVWLDAPLSALLKRLSGDRNRPLLQTDDLALKLETLMSERHRFYQQADVRVSSGKSDKPKAVAERVVNAVETLIQSQPAPTEPP